MFVLISEPILMCCALSLSCVWLFVTPWTIAPPGSSFHGDSPGNNTGLGCHAIPWRNPGDLPIPGIEPRSPTLQADSLLSEPPGKPSTDVFLLPEVHSLYDSLVAQWWRIHLPIQELWVWSLGQEDALGKEIEMHSSILA